MPPTPHLLPAYGWTAHSEQTDPLDAALASHRWALTTDLMGSLRVTTHVLSRPKPADKRRLEEIAAHATKCADPRCKIGHNAELRAMVGPDGKFNDDVYVFLTMAFCGGQPMMEFRNVAVSPESATKNHFGCCAMLTGSLASWANIEMERV